MKLKKVKKISKWICFGMVIGVLAMVLPTLAEGYQMYAQAVGAVGIDERIEQIKADDSYVPINQISDQLLNAVVAIEDRRFYKHHGIDFVSTGRAAVSNLTNRDTLTGGSTLTQQLAKNMYFTFEKKYSRKVAELMVAIQLENKLSKREILELYANVVYFGNGYNGVKEASNGYFGIEPKDLSVEQSIMLAGIPQSPSRYSLKKPGNQMGIRANQVIQAMIRGEYLAGEEASHVQQRTIEVIETIY
jgi:membrane peptidoglycan carboxypeptidase